jgi:hypothetical protein
MITERTVYSIYVLELGASALDDRRFDHPRRDPDKPCLYVGSTAKPLEIRYAEHQTTGAKTQADAVRKHGFERPRPDLAQGKHAYSREKAEEMEARLADSLRSSGYDVSQA